MADDLTPAAAEALEQSRELRAKIWPSIAAALAETQNTASVLMALAECAGDVIGLDASEPAHLEEGLHIFASLASEQARGRFLASESHLQGRV